MTRDEVLERSRGEWKGMTTFCWDCDPTYDAVQMPCSKHLQSDEEQAEYDRRFTEKVNAMAMADNPFIKALLRQR